MKREAGGKKDAEGKTEEGSKLMEETDAEGRRGRMKFDGEGQDRCRTAKGRRQ